MLAPELLWLRELLDQEQWEQVLQVARQLLLRGGFTPVELAEINYAVSRARAYRQELMAAIPAGELARRLAADAGQWDLYARASLVVGVCYHRLRNFDAGLNALYACFEHQDRHAGARDIEGHVWFNIGNVHWKQGRTREAVAAYNQARCSYRLRGDVIGLFRVNFQLSGVLLDHHVDAVPAVLAEMRRCVRSHPKELNFRATYLLCRARYAARLGALAWSAALCRTGLRDDNQDSEKRVECFLVLANVMGQMARPQDALIYAFAARMTAVRNGYYDLEFSAMELICDLLAAHGHDHLHALDQEYMNLGLDLSGFVSREALREQPWN